MVNPDDTSGIGGASIAGIIMGLILFFSYPYLETNRIALYIGLPLLAYVIAFITHIITQYAVCEKVNVAKVAIGSVTSLVLSLVALLLASITMCRIPVISAFAPLFKDATTVPAVKNSCCKKEESVEALETRNPNSKGVSYAFYMIFAMLFGVTYGNSIAVNCST